MSQPEAIKTRPVYLVIYHSPLFAAHWSLWIPKESDRDLGKIIHVHGSVAEGFEHEFKRNYRLSEDSRSSSIRLLNTVPVTSIVDPEIGTFYTDTTRLDIIEEIALKVAAPGPSLRQNQKPGLRTRVELKNCQTWIVEFVACLVKYGVFAESAISELEKCPKN